MSEKKIRVQSKKNAKRSIFKDIQKICSNSSIVTINRRPMRMIIDLLKKWVSENCFAFPDNEKFYKDKLNYYQPFLLNSKKREEKMAQLKSRTPKLVEPLNKMKDEIEKLLALLENDPNYSLALAKNYFDTLYQLEHFR